MKNRDFLPYSKCVSGLASTLSVKTWRNINLFSFVCLETVDWLDMKFERGAYCIHISMDDVDSFTWHIDEENQTEDD